jgi:concanavalin A-like lectin/glucanase superfamily protein
MKKLILLLLLPFLLSAYDPNITGTQGLYQADAVGNFTLSGVDIQAWSASAGAVAVDLNSDAASDPVYDATNKLIDFVGGARALQNADVYDISTVDFNLMVYFKTGSDVTTAQYIISKGVSADHYRIFISGGKIYIRIYEGGAYWVDYNQDIAIDTNYFVYISLDKNGTQFIYVNDSRVLNQTVTETDDLNNADNFRVGLGGTTYYFGKIYEVRITNTATTEADAVLYYADLQCRYLNTGCLASNTYLSRNKRTGRAKR